MRLFIGIALFLGLLAGGDAAVRSYAESTIAGRLARDLNSEDVHVSLGGFPFVVGLLSGHISEAELVAREVRRGDLEIARVVLEVEGLKVSLADAERGTGSATVERGEGSAELELAELAAFLSSRIQGGSVRIREGMVILRIPSLDRRVRARMRLEDDQLVLGGRGIDDIEVPLPRVLRNVSYDDIAISGDEAELTFGLRNTQLRSL